MRTVGCCVDLFKFSYPPSTPIICQPYQVVRLLLSFFAMFQSPCRMERRDRAREIHRHFRHTARSTIDYRRLHNSFPEQDVARFGRTTAATVSTKHYAVHVLSRKVFKYYPYTSLF